uniref:Uncharacterized protein n=1 Tax=Globodera rostochiensis TaxID=31243 RepID=A0A914HR55_GLORO
MKQMMEQFKLNMGHSEQNNLAVHQKANWKRLLGNWVHACEQSNIGSFNLELFPQTILTLIHLMKMFCRLCILKLLLTKMHGHGTVAQRADGIRAALKSDSDLVGIVMASRSTGGDGVKGIF